MRSSSFLSTCVEEQSSTLQQDVSWIGLGLDVFAANLNQAVDTSVMLGRTPKATASSCHGRFGLHFRSWSSVEATKALERETQGLSQR